MEMNLSEMGEVMRDYNEKPTPAHIEAAIRKCSEINNMRNTFNKPCRWAEMEVVPTRNRAIVRVNWGPIRWDGVREKEIETINFDMSPKGEVVVSKHVHT